MGGSHVHSPSLLRKILAEVTLDLQQLNRDALPPYRRVGDRRRIFVLTLVNSCSRFAVRSAVRCQYSRTSTARLTEARLQLVNRVHQSQRFLVRQNRLFHLVHYVRECDSIFRIDKGVTAARTGMPEGCCGWSEHTAGRIL